MGDTTDRSHERFADRIARAVAGLIDRLRGPKPVPVPVRARPGRPVRPPETR